MQEYYDEILKKIKMLTIYKNVLNDDLMQSLKELCISEDRTLPFTKLSCTLIEKAEEQGYSGNIFESYILDLFLRDENVFSIYCENNIDITNTSVYKLALNDIRIMLELKNMELVDTDVNLCSEIYRYVPINKKENELMSYIKTLETAESIMETFIKFYNTSGCGNISSCRMFKYSTDKGLIGIKKPDPITFDDIIGYKAQTKILIENTEAFLKGYPANNVLLVGSRGTGKSSSVKALSNKYFEAGLRMIEITKEQIVELPKLLSILKDRGRKFIIYIDDLSFDEQEIQYKYMKSLLDGGSESKPDNVLFYATSNRRHLIQEKWGDRSRGSEEAEIHTTDTLNEKLSLADRFGITITYPKPTPKEYIEMVKGLADRNNIQIDDEILEKSAMQWEINQKGMSGRTAKQFINNLLWEINK